MAVNTALREDEEQRLAALWAQQLDDAPLGAEPPDDVIAALFAAPGRAERRQTPRTRGNKARRPAARAQSARLQGSRAGQRLAQSRATNRSIALVAMLVAALVLIPLARSALTGPVGIPATHPRATADRPRAPSPSALPSRSRLELRRIRAMRARAHRRQEHQRAIARANRRRSRAARRERAAPRARAHVRSRSAGRFVAIPPAPPDPIPKPTAPVSSACDEFPPC